ncbi:hypothetical protein ACVJH7_000517 [Bradyrhizobium elkanii]
MPALSSRSRMAESTSKKINYPMLYQDKATPAEYWAGLQHAKDQGWLEYHESGTFVRMLQPGKDLFA